MKWLSFCAVLLASVLAFAGSASADVIIDCSGQPEGSICTTPDGQTGECVDVDGTLECQEPSSGEDAGTDAGEDAGPSEDAGTDAGEPSSSDDSSDDEGCSVSSGFGGPVNTLAPIFVGLGLLAVARRRE